MNLIGLMSGTSADGVDAALVEITGAPPDLSVREVAFLTQPYDDATRAAILDLCRPDAPLLALGRVHALLGQRFAEAALAVVAQAGLAPPDVALIGSHGQTVYHAPATRSAELPDGNPPFTLQIGDPAVIAARTGITTVADFRAADVAAGGQGAPLVPYPDWLMWHHPTRARALQNIGGIANVTYLPAGGGPESVVAFDTGPGNVLIDAVAARATDGDWRCDRDGTLAAQGRVDERLLAHLLDHPYLHQPPPKSTGRETFGAAFADDLWERAQARHLAPADLAATVTAFTAATIAGAYRRWLPAPPDEVFLCGGGADNPTLVRLIREHLARVFGDTALVVRHYDETGYSSAAKEAVAFAILAYETWHGRPANLPQVTGASHPVVLGHITPAPHSHTPKPRSYFLGIDGGGTKTIAVLLDGDRREIARATSGPSNCHSVGQTMAEASLREAIHRVLASAGLTTADVTAIGAGLAGVGRPGEQRIVQDILSRIAHFRRVVITHDAETALVGGVGRRYGAVLIAGTGAISYGVNARGEARRADGWGYLLGDEGSAYWIGVEGLRAVARAHDGRGPATILETLLVAYLGLRTTGDLVAHIYAGDFDVPRLAALAPLVSQAAQNGDAVAQAILREAGRRLGGTLSAVIRGLDMTEEVFEVVLMGSVLCARGLVQETVITALVEVAPRARVIEPRHDAATGAALLAEQRGE